MDASKLGDGWYFTREQIDKFSPSRLDGIDAKKEANLRKSYCSFIKEIGVHVKLPQVAIGTAIIFCHRFYMRQSHRTNDRYTIATACIFLATKVEEVPIPLKDVTMLAYEIRYKRDPTAAERIRQKDCYEQQKQLVVMAERIVLSTLAFDFNVQHPYRNLVSAIKIFKVEQNSLAQVAWNFVNDGLMTTLCLQFKPQHIAAGAIFLAAKFLKVKLPSDGEKPWWEVFEVTPRQLEEVSNQMLELYEQTKSTAATTADDISSPQGMDDKFNSSHKEYYTGRFGLVKRPYQKQLFQETSTIYLLELFFSLQPDCDDIAGQAPNINSCNAKAGSDAMLGHVNQGSAIPKAFTNWSKKSTSEAIKNSPTESELTLMVSSGKKGNTDIQESTYQVGERKRKRTSQLDGSDSSAIPARNGYSSSYKFSRKDAPFGEISTLTSADKEPTTKGMVPKQATADKEPTTKGMVPKQAKDGYDHRRNNIY